MMALIKTVFVVVVVVVVVMMVVQSFFRYLMCFPVLEGLAVERYIQRFQGTPDCDLIFCCSTIFVEAPSVYQLITDIVIVDFPG